MALFITTFFIMLLAVGGMAVGVVLGRSPIAGSCGGLNTVDGSSACVSCSRPCRSRRRAQARSASADKALDTSDADTQVLNRIDNTTGMR